jgi:hypothetical protein
MQVCGSVWTESASAQFLGEPNSTNFVVTKSNRDHCHLANLVK